MEVKEQRIEGVGAGGQELEQRLVVNLGSSPERRARAEARGGHHGRRGDEREAQRHESTGGTPANRAMAARVRLAGGFDLGAVRHHHGGESRGKIVGRRRWAAEAPEPAGSGRS